MYEHIKSDKIENEVIREKVEVASVIDKMRKWDWDGLDMCSWDVLTPHLGDARGWITGLRGGVGIGVRVDWKNIEETDFIQSGI